METGFALIQVELPSGIKFKQSGYNQLEEKRNKRDSEEKVDSSSTRVRPSRHPSHHSSKRSLEKRDAGEEQQSLRDKRRASSISSSRDVSRRNHVREAEA